MRHKEGHHHVLNRISFLIHAERKVRDLTQQEVAEKLRITQGSLSKLENGETTPNVIVWLRFCEVFGLPENIPLNDGRYRVRAKQLEKLASKGRVRIQVAK